MATIRLRSTRVPDGNFTFYFYDGETEVRNGIIEIDSSRPEWVMRAWIMGFGLDPDGAPIPDIDAYVRDAVNLPEGAVVTATTPELQEALSAPERDCCEPDCCDGPCCKTEGKATRKSCTCHPDFKDTSLSTPVSKTENAESDEENDDASAADGGLSPDEDGVRSSEPGSDGSLPEGGVDGRDGDEPADGGATD